MAIKNRSDLADVVGLGGEDGGLFEEEPEDARGAPGRGGGGPFGVDCARPRSVLRMGMPFPESFGAAMARLEASVLAKVLPRG